jgi:UDP-N-acetylmuramoyl-tripeptide--D-alanyl-D-alanine ligase
MKRRFIERVLKIMAKSVLAKRKPMVVGITGSVGKTTTKEALAKVLALKFRVRSSQKNYNTEIGAPLTILGCQVDYSKNKILQILGVFSYWLQALFFDKNYPEVLVLELGADKPGDIKYFCDFIPITVGVLTDIGISHLEKFKTRQNLATEKGHLLRSIQSNGLAVYNYDNKIVREIGKKISVSAMGYGFDSEADLIATDVLNKIEVSRESQKFEGTSFKLNYQGKVLPVRLERSAGKGVVYSVLVAFSVGIYFDLNLIEMIETLRNFEGCSRRMNFIFNSKGFLLIDDSYNSAPGSLEVALELVKEAQAERKILVIGDMLELGDEEKISHKKIVSKVIDIKPDYFIAIGNRMREAGMDYQKKFNQKTKVVFFDNSEIAKDFVKKTIKAGDLILIKGSFGIKLNKITNYLMK